MKLTKRWEMLRIYISEDARYKKHSLYHSLVLKLKEMGMAGVTVTRCLEGYGKSKAIRNAKILDLSSSLPIIVEVVDETEKIEKAAPIIKEMVDKGLITVSYVDILKYN